LQASLINKQKYIIKHTHITGVNTKTKERLNDLKKAGLVQSVAEQTGFTMEKMFENEGSIPMEK